MSKVLGKVLSLAEGQAQKIVEMEAALEVNNEKFLSKYHYICNKNLRNLPNAKSRKNNASGTLLY